MSNRATRYFEEPGRENVSATIQCVSKRLNVGDIEKVFIFAANFSSVAKLVKAVEGRAKVNVVTFPYEQIFYKKTTANDYEEIVPETSKKIAREKLRELGVELVQGSLPLDDIVIPGATDSKLKVIRSTLDMISQGMSLCIDAALMACDSGSAEQGEHIIVMSADTAIVVSAAHKAFMFHPQNGIKVREIICKPY